MEQLQQITALIEPIVERHGLKLYQVSWGRMQHMRMLDISVYSDSDDVSLDLITAVSEPISIAIDESGLLDFEYLLNIGSPGAERELQMEELEGKLNQYVFVKFKNPTQGADSVYGTLLAVTDDSITLQYQVKQAKKTIEITKENIAKIRLAVRV